MTLIVETGQGGADSESLASVADALAYHTARGNSPWLTVSTQQQEEALRRGTDYLAQMYRGRWKGARTNATQALDWPRYGVQLDDVGAGAYAAIVSSTSVPTEVRNACCELAMRAAAGDLTPDLTRQVKEKTIGPITTIYSDGTPQYVRFRQVDMMLRPLLEGSGISGRMVRA